MGVSEGEMVPSSLKVNQSQFGRISLCENYFAVQISLEILAKLGSCRNRRNISKHCLLNKILLHIINIFNTFF